MSYMGAHYTDKAMGMLERLTGVTLDFSLPTDGTVVKAAWSDWEPLEARRWRECHAEGVEPIKISGKVVAARRVGRNGPDGLAVAETVNAPAKITLSCDMTDLLSGKVYHRGENEIAPYAVAVLKQTE